MPSPGRRVNNLATFLPTNNPFFSLKEATTFLFQNQVLNFTNFREYLLNFYFKNLQLPFWKKVSQTPQKPACFCNCISRPCRSYLLTQLGLVVRATHQCGGWSWINSSYLKKKERKYNFLIQQGQYKMPYIHLALAGLLSFPTVSLTALFAHSLCV